LKDYPQNLRMLVVVKNSEAFDSHINFLKEVGYFCEDIEIGSDIYKELNIEKIKKETGSLGNRSEHINLVYVNENIPPGILEFVLTTTDFKSIKYMKFDTLTNSRLYPSLSDIEREHILNTLFKCNWKCKETARLLGIDRSTLYRKMAKFGLTRISTIEKESK